MRSQSIEKENKLTDIITNARYKYLQNSGVTEIIPSEKKLVANGSQYLDVKGQLLIIEN